MNEVEFRVEPEELGIGVETVVNIFIDGAPLREMVRDVEFPFAQAAGQPELAGDHAGLSAELDILWPSRHFLGEPVIALDGRPYLLACVCGWPECHPVTARIEVGAAKVTWTEWRGRWELSKLATLTFDRDSYEQALRQPTRS